MLAYSTIGTNDIARARAFYTELFKVIGARPIYDRPDGKLISYGRGDGTSAFTIAIPYNGETASPGNGNMVAIAANGPEQVEALYKKALSLGAECEGPAGPRLGGDEYCGYVRDLDGNKLNFFFIKSLGLNKPKED